MTGGIELLSDFLTTAPETCQLRKSIEQSHWFELKARSMVPIKLWRSVVPGNNLKCVFVFGLICWVGLPTAAWSETSQLSSCQTTKSEGLRSVVPTMMAGPLKGQSIDTSTRCPIVLLEQDTDAVRFENFYHHGKYWRATLQLNSVLQTIFQIEKFPAPAGVTAAHTQLRFNLDPLKPLFLKSQESSASASPGKILRITSFVVSFEYAAPRNVPFDIFKGLTNNFQIVGRVMSFDTRAREQVYSAHHDVRQFRLKLSTNDSARIAFQAIRRSQQLGFRYSYNTISENCTTEPFALLDSTIRYGHAVSAFEVGWPLLDPVSGASLRALKERGLIDNFSEISTVAQEIIRPQI